MAKKEQIPEKVLCRDCVSGGTEENFLIECFNRSANPGGAKKAVGQNHVYIFSLKNDNYLLF